MGTIYLCIVIFLLCLAVFDLFVGVSNDAVNFLQSAIGEPKHLTACRTKSNLFTKF